MWKFTLEISGSIAGKIRAIMTYPKEVGRNISEILRTVIALQTTEEHKIINASKTMPILKNVQNK